jgi:MFS transporter, DHA2 family, multidrug resistance protein
MDQGLPTPRRFLAIASVSAGSVLYTLDAHIANVALPDIARALHLSAASSVLPVSVYNLVLAMALLPLASLGDRLGHKRIFTAGLLLYLVAAVLCYLADSLAFLLIARSVQALAAGSVLSVSMAMVRNIYPASQLGRGLGFNTIAAASGAAMAPALGGLILSLAPWNWVFAAGAPLALIALAFTAWLPDPERRAEPFDLGGMALCATTFGLLIFGFQKLAEGHNPVTTSAILLAGFVTAFILVRHQLGVALPVLPIDLLARPALALSVAAAIAAVLSSTALLLDVPFRLHEMGFGPAEIGAMLAPFAVTNMIVSPASGMLSDRISPSILGTVGLTIAVIAAVCLAFIPDHPDYFDISWRTALCGTGFGMFFSPNGRLIIGAAPHGRAAAASSLVGTTRMFGQALGSTLLGGLLALNLAASVPALVAAGLAALGLLFSAARIALPGDEV